MIHRVPLIVAPTRRQVLRTMAGAAGALAFPRLGRAAIASVARSGIVYVEFSPDLTTVAIDTTGATLLIGCVVVQDASAGSANCTVVDSETNTWRTTTNSPGDNTYQITVWYAYDKAGAALSTSATHTVTINCTSALSQLLQLRAYSGTTGDPLDLQREGPTSNETGTVQSTASLTPSQDNCLIVSVFGGQNGTAASINGSFTNADVRVGQADERNLGAADLIQTTAAAANPTWTVTAGNHLSIKNVSFKPTGGSSGGCGIKGTASLKGTAGCR